PQAPPQAPPLAAEAPRGASTLTGETAPLRQSALACKGSGLLTSLSVEEGQRVEVGQRLASLDDTLPRLRLRQAKAAVKGAQIQLKAARREAKRLGGLQAKQAIAEAKVDDVQTAVEGAMVSLEAAEISLAMARQALKDTTLTAPYAGVITRKLKAEGEWISMMPPSPVVVLAQIDPLELRLEAPASLLGRIKVGDPLKVRLDALSRIAEVKVARVIPVVGANRAFTIIAELPNPDGALSPGLFVEAEWAR
ncbi:efflux RND transporter periplasmic adaptor subunit, partial [Myxococcota bacterium]|nr:efflux RND transporter periplasmic adaptor subunit [Myxococcota bacterium]